MEASLDFSGVDGGLAAATPNAASGRPQSQVDLSLNLSEIESTLQELSGGGTPTKSESLDRSFSSPPAPPSMARVPSSNAIEFSRSYSSQSLRMSSPASPKAKQSPIKAPDPPSTAAKSSPGKPAVQRPPASKPAETVAPQAPAPAPAATVPVQVTVSTPKPTPALAPTPAAASATAPASPTSQASTPPPPVRTPSSHSFAGSFEAPSKRAATPPAGAAPDSPKIRSKLSHSYIPPLEEDLSEAPPEIVEPVPNITIPTLPPPEASGDGKFIIGIWLLKYVYRRCAGQTYFFAGNGG